MVTPLSEIVYFIVPYGIGSKIVQCAKKLGAFSGNIILAEGTVAHHVLDLLCLNENKKEIVTLFIADDKREHIMGHIIEQFKIEKKHKGIAYTIPNYDREKGEQNTMYQLITVIVDKGVAQEVISASSKAGSKGGTIINARGSSIYNTQRLFHMEIEPEKETVLIVALQEKVEEIIEEIDKSIHLEDTHSILFVQPIQQAYGILE
ncbi:MULTISPECIES: P-II family nitrogen regulator [unclassified Granulicatella]|uniref:P-II family nitrogen regulator n=1 Tax=unclassified Granulicatella TaxID=2630493 RepID=UPI001073C00D|nr:MULTISPECIES: P-II family nitrogen regulator [unclassified Granulicatella]MBF0780828.1 P-II family nitrogen regulator [Granulicatella sp. 19428wC4_WM01]TFU93535.1 P-II family nitrogen regulator [Granulicatella sp. WM01]